MRNCLVCKKNISDLHCNSIRCMSCQKKYRTVNRHNKKQQSDYAKQYREKNKERMSECDKNWYIKNRDKKLQYAKKYREINKEKLSKNKDKRNKYNREYYKKNMYVLNEKNKQWRKNNPEYMKRYMHEYYIINKDCLLQKMKEYSKTKKGKEIHNKTTAIRKRKLDWIKIIDNPFPDNIEVHWHHVNNSYVFPIPKQAHLRYLGKQHRNKCNEWIEIYFDINLMEMIKCHPLQ